jgi:tryptophanyl-tRNA synthetase
MFPERVLSGMRPTGLLHLGHYHGVLKNWVNLQEKLPCLFFVADWHALTTHYDSPQVIKESVWNMVIDWLAAGVDPEKATLFIQSKVPEHAELHLLLSMNTPLSWLERVPTYKDQQDKLNEKDLATYGFLGYPLLQSADILVYRATHVPVGEDQVPHIELTREIARRFNHFYSREKLIVKGEEIGCQPILLEPKALLTEASKMPGLDGHKMSKSYNNILALRETPDNVSLKIRRMPTDPARVRRNDPGDPEKCPVWQLHQVYSDDKTRLWVDEGCKSANIGCIQCKEPIIDAINQELAPIRDRAAIYTENPSQLRSIIDQGCDKARAMASETMKDVRKYMGLDYS